MVRVVERKKRESSAAHGERGSLCCSPSVRSLLLSTTEAADSHMKWRERGHWGKSRGWEKSGGGSVKRNEGDLRDLVEEPVKGGVARKLGSDCSIG